MLKIQLAWSESGAYVDTGANESSTWWDGWAWWNSFAANPSSAGTRWFFDNNASYLNVGVNPWTDAWATFDAWFYNDDSADWYNATIGVPHLDPQRTYVEHWTDTYAAPDYGHQVGRTHQRIC